MKIKKKKRENRDVIRFIPIVNRKLCSFWSLNISCNVWERCIEVLFVFGFAHFQVSWWSSLTACSNKAERIHKVNPSIKVKEHGTKFCSGHYKRDSCSSHIVLWLTKSKREQMLLSSSQPFSCPPDFSICPSRAPPWGCGTIAQQIEAAEGFGQKIRAQEQFWTIGTGLTDFLFQNNWKHCKLILLSLCRGEISIIYRQSGLW